MAKRKQNPLHQILNDLKTLGKLAMEGSIHAPEFHRKLIQDKIQKVLSRYVITRKRINRTIKNIVK